MIKRQSPTDPEYSVMIYRHISAFQNKNISKTEPSTHLLNVLLIIPC